MEKKIDFSSCKNEQQFKMKYIKEILKPQFDRVFCIETEETASGFPDVMCLSEPKVYTCRAMFFEFKYSNAHGKIKFQPTQPAFYKANNKVMHIIIVAYNKKANTVHEFYADDVFNKDSPYCMNEISEVQL